MLESREKGTCRGKDGKYKLKLGGLGKLGISDGTRKGIHIQNVQQEMGWDKNLKEIVNCFLL